MSTDRASDRAILAGIAATIRDVVMPALERNGSGDDAFARVTAVQLAGLAGYAANRSADPGLARRQHVLTTLDLLRDNEVVRQCRSRLVEDEAGAGDDPLEVAAAALVACVGRTDAVADEVRAVLRPVLVAQLDDELTSTMTLMDAFRGRLGNA